MQPRSGHGVCLVYVRKGREPPPDIVGWKRLPQDEWAFEHDYGVKCSGMLPMMYKQCCGVYSAVTICNKDGCPYRTSYVEPATCQACVYREGVVDLTVEQVLPRDYSPNQAMATARALAKAKPDGVGDAGVKIPSPVLD